MNGNTNTSQEDARAALQALLAGNRGHTEDAARGGQAKPTPNGVGGADAAHEQAGSALRSILRAEFQKVLRPPKAAKQAVEIEAEVSRLLESVAGPHHQEPRRAGAAAGDAEVSRAQRPPCADAGMQTEGLASAALLQGLLAEEPPPEPPPEQHPVPRRRSLVVRAEGPTGSTLRTQVQDARRRLHALDKEVTSLTAELKRCRSNLWNQQRRQCSSEAQLSRLLKERASELPREEWDKDAKLQMEERRLAEELCEARALAAKWSSVAKRQDGMLHQERDHQRGDAQSILAKHPAGEVFLPNLSQDGDSEDGYDAEGPRRPWQRSGAGGGNEDISLGTSDEEEDELRGGRPRPPTLRSPLGLESEKDDDSASGERSSMPSPSGESPNSASGRSPAASPAASPAGEYAGQGGLFGAHGSSGTSTQQPTSVRAGRRSRSSSESTSEEEDPPPPRNSATLSMAVLAGEALTEGAKKAEAGVVVPPLPEVQLSSTATRGRAMLPEDEAEEITSEEEFEAETSRSA